MGDDPGRPHEEPAEARCCRCRTVRAPVRLRQVQAGHHDESGCTWRRAGRHGTGGQRLQLVRLHRSRGHQGLRAGHRHQGPLRRLRLERGARDQAADGKLRLRRRRAERVFPPAPGAGGRVRAARQVEAARSRQHRSRPGRACGAPRSGQRTFGRLHVGHDRHRLRPRQGQGDHAGCAGRQLEADFRSGRAGEIQGLRRVDARRPDRHGRHGPAVPRQGSEQRIRGRPQGGRRRCC